MASKSAQLLRAAAFTVVGLAVLGYAAVCGWFYVNQRKLTYVPNTDAVAPASAGLPDFEKVAIRTPDGETLVGWWKPPAAGKGVVLYLHGNGHNISTRSPRLRDLADDGFGVLGLDWRGYGGSTGTPTQAGLLTDADAAFDWAAAHAGGSKIALFGESLGTGVAVHTAGERPAAGVLLDSPYASILRVGEAQYPWLPLGLFMKDRYTAEDWVQRVKAPIFIVHCDADQEIPLAEGERLYAAAPGPKAMSVLHGCAHIHTWQGEAKARMLADLHAWTER